LIALVLFGPKPEKPDAATQKKAKAHFKQGKAYQEAAEYGLAIDEYRQAYDLVQTPELLFNIGQAYRLHGEKEKAIENYQKFLEAVPEGRGTDDAREDIAKLKHELAEELQKREADRKEATDKRLLAVRSLAGAWACAGTGRDLEGKPRSITAVVVGAATPDGKGFEVRYHERMQNPFDLFYKLNPGQPDSPSVAGNVLTWVTPGHAGKAHKPATYRQTFQRVAQSLSTTVEADVEGKRELVATDQCNLVPLKARLDGLNPLLGKWNCQGTVREQSGTERPIVGALQISTAPGGYSFSYAESNPPAGRPAISHKEQWNIDRARELLEATIVGSGGMNGNAGSAGWMLGGVFWAGRVTISGPPVGFRREIHFDKATHELVSIVRLFLNENWVQVSRHSCRR
jgi:hypothetical protein